MADKDTKEEVKHASSARKKDDGNDGKSVNASSQKIPNISSLLNLNYVDYAVKENDDKFKIQIFSAEDFMDYLRDYYDKSYSNKDGSSDEYYHDDNGDLIHDHFSRELSDDEDYSIIDYYRDSLYRIESDIDSYTLGELVTLKEIIEWVRENRHDNSINVKDFLTYIHKLMKDVNI